MFNREYQRRAAQQGLRRAGFGLKLDESHFYRPAQLTAPTKEARLLEQGGRRTRQRDRRVVREQMSLPFPLTEAELAEDFEAIFS